jgi:hypothetical protein
LKSDQLWGPQDIKFIPQASCEYAITGNQKGGCDHASGTEGV